MIGVDSCITSLFEEEFHLLGDEIDFPEDWRTHVEEFDVHNLGPLMLDEHETTITPDIFMQEEVPQGQTVNAQTNNSSITGSAQETLSESFSLLIPGGGHLPFVSNQYALSLESLEQKMRKSAESRRRLRDLCNGITWPTEIKSDSLKISSLPKEVTAPTAPVVSKSRTQAKRKISACKTQAPNQKKLKTRRVSICNQ